MWLGLMLENVGDRVLKWRESPMYLEAGLLRQTYIHG